MYALKTRKLTDWSSLPTCASVRLRDHIAVIATKPIVGASCSRLGLMMFGIFGKNCAPGSYSRRNRARAPYGDSSELEGVLARSHFVSLTNLSSTNHAGGVSFSVESPIKSVKLRF